MAGPWERYKQPTREPASGDGPWARFKSEGGSTPAGFLDVNELGSATREIMDAGNDFVTATSDTIKPGIARATGSVINAVGEPVEKWTGLMAATTGPVAGAGYDVASRAIAGETEQARDVIRTANTDIGEVVGRYDDGSAGYYGALTGATAPATVAGVSLGLASRNPTVGMTAFALPAYGDAYSQARMEEGASIPEAMGYGALQAGAEVVTELPMLRVFRGLNVPGMNRIANRISDGLGRASRAVNSSAVGRTGVAVASEAGSEAASQFIGSGVDVGMGYEEADLDQMLTGMRDAAVLGGVMGGALYGATKPIRMTDEVRQLRARERVDQIRTELRSLQGQEAADYLAKVMESADPYTQGLIANSITETDLAAAGLTPPPAQRAPAGAPPAPAATQPQAPAKTPASGSLAAPLMDELAATNQQTELDLEGQILQQSQVNAAAQQQAAAQQAELDQYAAEDAAEAEQLAERGLRLVGREERGRSEPVTTPYSEAVPQREDGEEDSAYAYRAIKDLPIPESLPEDLPRMFHMSKADAVVSLDKLRPLAGKEARSSDNSSRFMALAREGKLEARDPVDVRVEEDGTYTVLDGNGTFAAAKKYGWGSIPIRIKEAPAGQEGFRISRGTLARPAANKLVKKYEVAQQAKSAFDSLINNLAASLGGKFKGADLKGRTRAEQKIKDEYAINGVSEEDAVDMLNDLVRGTMEFDSVTEARSAIAELGKRLKIVKIKDGISDGAPPRFETGYRDANLIVEMPNGTRAEVQISVTPLLEAKKAGHKLYEEFRPIDAKKRSGQELSAFEQSRFDILLKEQQELYGAAWERALAGKPAAAARASNDSGETDSTRVDGPTANTSSLPDESRRAMPQDLPSSNAIWAPEGSTAIKSIEESTANQVPSGSERGSADRGSMPMKSTSATGESSSADGQSVAPAVKSELTDGEIRAIVDTAAKALPGVKFEVVDSFDAIPLEARQDMDGTGVAAIYGADGKIYVIGPEVVSRDDLTESLKHEVGHAGLKVLLGKKYAATMRKVYTHAAANPKSVAGQYLAKIRAQYPDASTIELADEIVAHMAEAYGQLVPAERGILQRIAESIRSLMQKAGLLEDVSDAEIYRMIVAGRRALAQEVGDGQQQGEPRASRAAARRVDARRAQGRAREGDGQSRVPRRDGEAGQPADQADADASTPEWNDRPVQPDAVALDAIHWSNTDGLTELDPQKYGTNHKGGEWKRVMGFKPSDPRRQRLSVYIKGTPFESRPESMIAREARYGVRLTNMYPMDDDPRDFRGKFANIQSDTAFWNAVEKAVVDGGFDGWFSANTWGVVLGTKPVRVARARKRGSDVGHKRESSGRYVGAPDWVGDSPQQLALLRKKLRQLATEGEAGRYWYENSSRAILQMVGGDKAEAEKLVALIAIYSPSATVPANTSMALTAYYQWKAGQPINAGFSLADKKAEDLLRNNNPWSGIKTNSFYQNLMVEIDPSKLDPGTATMDMWMAIAFDYGSKTLDQGPKYKFAERETQRLAEELGWTAHQVQAAIWTAMKGRIDPIRKDLAEKEMELGIGEIVEKNGKMVQRYKPSRKYDHFRLAHKMGMEYNLQLADIEASKYDFSDALGSRLAQISWEATPGETTGVLPGLLSAPIEQKGEYLAAIMRTLSPNGRDLIADAVGLPEGVTLSGFSAWKGDIGSGAQTFIPVPSGGAGKTRAVKTEARDLIGLYAAMRGYVLAQEAVVWHQPVYDDAKVRQNGASIVTARALNEAEMRQLYTGLIEQFGTDQIAPGYTANGARVLNFTDIPNKLFQSGVTAVVQQLDEGFGGGILDLGSYRSDGEYIGNDWTESPNGEGFENAIVAAGRPDLLERAADLRARVEAVNRDFAQRYGWGAASVAEAAAARGVRLDRGRDGRGAVAPAQEAAEASPEPRARRLPAITAEQRQMLAARELRLPVEIDGEVQQLSGNALKIIERARQRVENLERLSACLAS